MFIAVPLALILEALFDIFLREHLGSFGNKHCVGPSVVLIVVRIHEQPYGLIDYLLNLARKLRVVTWELSIHDDESITAEAYHGVASASADNIQPGLREAHCQCSRAGTMLVMIGLVQFLGCWEQKESSYCD